VDFRSDQFALGLIVYEMVTGRRAFSRPTAVETLAAVIREEPAPPSSLRADVPQALQALIARCLAKRPEDRFASTRELAAALESLGQGLASGSFAATVIAVAPPPVTPAALRRRRLPRRAAFVLGAVVALALAAAAWVRLRAPASAIDSLAVLPFVNAAKDPEAEYLSDGITESLINQMSRVPSLKVMARATVFRFKGTPDPQEAGRKLGVGAILTGNVSRRGDRLLISAELMEIATGARRWGEKYDRPFADLLRVQDSIASEISDALRLRLSTQQRSTLGGHGTENPEAYELFLKARFYLLRDNEEGDLEARRLYLQAVERDPKFADAHVGIATTYSRSAVGGYARPAEAWPRAEEETRKALDLDPGNVLARCVLAHRHFFYDWDWARTEREYRDLANDSRLFLGEFWRPIALFHWARGRTDEAIALIEKALRVDPGDLVSRIMMGNLLAQAGRLDDAIGFYRAVAQSEPSDPRPLFGLSEVLKRRGDVKGAIDARRRAYELSGEEDGAKALAAAVTEKDYEDAEAAVARFRLGELETLSKERYVCPLDTARLQAQVAEREKAFANLEAAFTERSAGLVFLKVEQAWDGVRDDARFAALVRRIGIP
jgi:TolB-like protein/cytochrome c-type biogenesis protein CcmH/NrfG